MKIKPFFLLKSFYSLISLIPKHNKKKKNQIEYLSYGAVGTAVVCFHYLTFWFRSKN